MATYANGTIKSVKFAKGGGSASATVETENPSPPPPTIEKTYLLSQEDGVLFLTSMAHDLQVDIETTGTEPNETMTTFTFHKP